MYVDWFEVPLEASEGLHPALEELLTAFFILLLFRKASLANRRGQIRRPLGDFSVLDIVVSSRLDNLYPGRAYKPIRCR